MSERNPRPIEAQWFLCPVAVVRTRPAGDVEGPRFVANRGSDIDGFSCTRVTLGEDFPPRFQGVWFLVRALAEGSVLDDLQTNREVARLPAQWTDRITEILNEQSGANRTFAEWTEQMDARQPHWDVTNRDLPDAADVDTRGPNQ